MICIPLGNFCSRDHVDRRLLLAFGSKSIKAFRLLVHRSPDSDRHPLSVGFELVLDVPHLKDWILDAQWLWKKDELSRPTVSTHVGSRDSVHISPSSIAIAYAHNFVEVYDLSEDPLEATTVSTLADLRLSYTVQSEERCTLFCGRFHNNTLEDLVFASGTSFCQTLVWKVHHLEGRDAPVDKTLVGHEGILFGIRWSEDGSHLTTVSDDRTIRLWDLTKADTPHVVLYGHMARVWDCQMAGQYLVSISEDATCRIWKNPIGTEASADGFSDCLACWEGHEGKNTWSVAIANNGIVATGGGDGGIHLWRLDSVAESAGGERDTKPLRLPSIDTYAPGLEINKADFPRDFVLLSHSMAVMSTQTGYLLCFDREKEEWSTLMQTPTLQNYSTIEVSSCRTILVAACLDGSIWIVSPSRSFTPLHITSLGNQKVSAVHAFSALEKNVFIVTAYRANNTMTVLRVYIGPSGTEASPVCNVVIPACYKIIHAVHFSAEYNLLLLGSREGAVVVYNLSTQEPMAGSFRSLHHATELTHCHGRDSVTSILLRTEEGEGHGGVNRVTVYSTGRDGSWAKYRLYGLPGGESVESAAFDDDDDDQDSLGGNDKSVLTRETISPTQVSTGDDGSPDMILKKVFRTKVTRGWLEQVLIFEDELLLVGFFNKKLFVHNESKHFEVFSMHCGAGSRKRWRFLIDNARLETVSLMFQAGDKVQVFHRQLSAGSGLFQNAKLQNNYHGREVRRLRFLRGAQFPADIPPPIVMASAGDDSVLRFFQYIPYKLENTTTMLRPVCSVKPYRGGPIRCLEWSLCSDPFSYVLFTGSAKESLRAWQVSLAIPNSFQPHLITGADGCQIPAHPLISIGCLELVACPQLSDDVEARVMDLSTFKLPHYPDYHFVVAVYSDAAVRVWLFDEKKHAFVISVDGSHHNHCILQTRLVPIGEGFLLFTAATDGKIALFDVSQSLQQFLSQYHAHPGYVPVKRRGGAGRSEFELQKQLFCQPLNTPLLEVAVHMSGINSLHVRDNGEGALVVVSGGDDNALVVTRIQATWDSTLQRIIVSDARVASREDLAHGAAIQGVNMLEEATVISTSQDQILTTWDLVTQTDGGLEVLEKRESTFVNVPDPSTMDVLHLQ
ncbi:WD repeat-containing protein 6 [Actinomortierella ambigua]|uniref:WD repeat-containing protein 6 n=1 Tax=Actinomortierella ambigua TaxID=1343610 RepID=A0A9P6PPP3_9FUNG|nr:WD repeat-containing protein 6 [Actinomortierella ambigua]